MIHVDLTGNLGNQMFIYACARKIQEQTHQDIKIHLYNIIHKHPDYRYNLDIFSLNENVEVDYDTQLPFYATQESLFYKLLGKLPVISKIIKKIYYKIFSKFNIYVWDDVTYVPINIANIQDDIFLSGFWQCPKYFKDIRDIILRDFSLKNKQISSEYLMKIIKDTNSVCISIRRGDYVSNPKYKLKHFVCDIDYFNRCVNEINKILNDPKIVIFSDDIEWVKNNIKYNIETYYESAGNTLSEKIALMSSCKHFILSNSSFSWWVEYLSTNEQKIVYAPSRWYASNIKSDIFQTYWKLINV